MPSHTQQSTPAFVFSYASINTQMVNQKPKLIIIHTSSLHFSNHPHISHLIVIYVFGYASVDSTGCMRTRQYTHICFHSRTNQHLHLSLPTLQHSNGKSKTESFQLILIVIYVFGYASVDSTGCMRTQQYTYICLHSRTNQHLHLSLPMLQHSNGKSKTKSFQLILTITFSSSHHLICTITFSSSHHFIFTITFSSSHYFIRTITFSSSHHLILTIIHVSSFLQPIVTHASSNVIASRSPPYDYQSLNSLRVHAHSASNLTLAPYLTCLFVSSVLQWHFSGSSPILSKPGNKLTEQTV